MGWGFGHAGVGIMGSIFDFIDSHFDGCFFLFVIACCVGLILLVGYCGGAQAEKECNWIMEKAVTPHDTLEARMACVAQAHPSQQTVVVPVYVPH
jgi:hypothetical protein